VKKLLGIVLFSAVLAVSTFAVDLRSFPSPIEKGSILINGGFGIGTTFIGTSAYTTARDFGALLGGYVAVDYALPINFALTVGGEIGFSGASAKDIGGVKAKMSIGVIPIMARVAWHPNFEVPNLDTYVLAKLGFALGFWGGDNGKLYKTAGATNPGGFIYGFDVGARYFFTDSLGAFAEVGYERYFLSHKYEYNIGGLLTGTVAIPAYANKFLTVGVTFKL
jgi:hypothetical protein